jgi:hypothetical protein
MNSNTRTKYRLVAGVLLIMMISGLYWKFFFHHGGPNILDILTILVLLVLSVIVHVDVKRLHLQQKNQLKSTPKTSRLTSFLRFLVAAPIIYIFLHLNALSPPTQVYETTYCNRDNGGLVRTRTYSPELSPGQCTSAKAVSTGWPIQNARISYYKDGELIGRNERYFNLKSMLNAFIFITPALLLSYLVVPHFYNRSLHHK